MNPELEHLVSAVFSQLSKASARKKVYARKAAREGRADLDLLLRAMAESEAVQARRLFNSLRGQIDTSEQYLSTIFETEVAQIIAAHAAALHTAEGVGHGTLTHVFSQLLAAEKRMRSFYAREKKELKGCDVAEYFICQFCGFINPQEPPPACPVCGAQVKDFHGVS